MAITEGKQKAGDFSPVVFYSFLQFFIDTILS